MSTVELPFTFAEGWGVSVALIWGNDDSDDMDICDTVVDLEIGVARITADTVKMMGNVPCVPWNVDYPDQAWIPIQNFIADLPMTNNDSHDARLHWFATESEAREHAKTVAEQWENPLPWQSFIQTD